MPPGRLSKRTADAAPSKTRPYVLRDSDLPGFGLRVMPSGYKTWVVEYRPADGGRRASTRRLSLGSDAALTADEARRKAKDVLATVRFGGDPARDRQASRAMPSFAEFAKRFIHEFCQPPNITQHTARLYSGNVRRLAIPAFGNLKLDAISKADIVRFHRRIGATHATQANNLLVTIASVFKYAVADGLLSEGTNPARGVERFKTKAKERFLTTEELGRLGEAIREAETRGLPWALNDLADSTKAKHRGKPENSIVVVPHDVAAALRLLIFTGCRKGEVLGLRWAEVDFQRGLLNLAEAKTGPRSVVLNAPALILLEALPRVGLFVFPGAVANEPRRDITNYWYRIRHRARLDGVDGRDPVRLHDLRHSFASFGVGGGMGLPIVGKLLGHTQARTTARYAHLDTDPVRRASNRIGTEIAVAMGEPALSGAAVVRLRASSGGRSDV